MSSDFPAVHAPEFDPELPWLNSDGPVSMRALRGCVVVIDFWTYCCVNCMHVVPVLGRIEERFAGRPLVVLGVHSAKFDAEQDPARVREAIARYGVAHPVLVDRGMRTWSAFAVRSWPTLVVVRPDGTIAAVAPGEPDEEVLTRFLEDELERAGARGQLKKRVEPGRSPSSSSSSSPSLPASPLSYPGKLAVGPGGSIAVADSGHHRVLLLDADGRVLQCFDGFDDPQGIVWQDEGRLLVADARAHTVVRVDVTSRRQEVVAGTGALGVDPLPPAGRVARATPLRSPWDLALDGGTQTLYVALAGSHQIAALDLARGTIARVAGTGAESIVDGPFEEATFSQPSGLALVGRTLYVADSETSAVRALDLEARRVRTLIGKGLFVFGDADGTPDVARLQHPLGVAADDAGALVVADTYNGKLRTLDARSGVVRAIAEGLHEPGGIAWEPGRRAWLVADTNAHRVVRVDGATGRIEVLAVEGAPPPRPRAAPASAPTSSKAPSSEWFTRPLRARPDAALAPGAAVLTFPVEAPAGKKFAEGSPVVAALEVSRRSDLLVLAATELRADGRGEPRLSLEARGRVEPLDADSVESEVVVRVDAVICDLDAAAAGALCEPWRAWLRLPVRLAKAGTSRLELG